MQGCYNGLLRMPEQNYWIIFFYFFFFLQICQTGPIAWTRKLCRLCWLCRDKAEIQQTVFPPSLILKHNHVIVWADVETHWSAISTHNISLSLQQLNSLTVHHLWLLIHILPKQHFSLNIQENWQLIWNLTSGI